LPARAGQDFGKEERLLRGRAILAQRFHEDEVVLRQLANGGISRRKDAEHVRQRGKRNVGAAVTARHRDAEQTFLRDPIEHLMRDRPRSVPLARARSDPRGKVMGHGQGLRLGGDHPRLGKGADRHQPGGICRRGRSVAAPLIPPAPQAWPASPRERTAPCWWAGRSRSARMLPQAIGFQDRQHAFGKPIGFFQVRHPRQDEFLDPDSRVFVDALGDLGMAADQRRTRPAAHQANASPQVGPHQQIVLAAPV
jgi:hypothetical protein